MNRMGPSEIAYWPKAGRKNSTGTLDAAVKRAGQLGVREFVVASNTGDTALALLERVAEEQRVVVVTHQVGFGAPGEDEMPPERRDQLQRRGARLLTTTHLMAGIDRAVRLKWGGIEPAELVACTLRMLGQGVKVAVEIAVMALDGGLIPHGCEVVSIGGTARGADTAIVVRPAHSQSLFDTRVHEIVCMPRP